MPGLDHAPGRSGRQHGRGPQSLSLGCDAARIRTSCFQMLRRPKCLSMKLLKTFLSGHGPRSIYAASAFSILSISHRSCEAQAQSSSSYDGEIGDPRRRGTGLMMAINVAVNVAQILSKHRLTQWGRKDNQLIRAGQLWRLITPVALHANLGHMLINTYFLHSLGPGAELWFGHQRFLTAYAVSGVAGAAASFARNPAPSVGASGAIFGLGGALTVHFVRLWPLFDEIKSTPPLASLGQSLFLTLMFASGNPNIDMCMTILHPSVIAEQDRKKT